MAIYILKEMISSAFNHLSWKGLHVKLRHYIIIVLQTLSVPLLLNFLFFSVFLNLRVSLPGVCSGLEGVWLSTGEEREEAGGARREAGPGLHTNTSYLPSSCPPTSTTSSSPHNKPGARTVGPSHLTCNLPHFTPLGKGQLKTFSYFISS